MRANVVIVPTYNEADNIVSIVSRTLAAMADLDVLIVDDDSPDGTGEIADALARTSPRVRVIHRAGKDGLGAAYLAGFAWAEAEGYLRVAEMDADGSHRPEQLPELFELAESCDLVLGSRWVPGGRVEGWSWSRHALSRAGSLYSRLVLGIGVRDVTGGFRVFRMDALRTIDLATVSSTGYCFQIDLLWRALQRGLIVREHPILFVDRTAGSSKMSGGIVAEALLSVTRWGIGRVGRALRPSPRRMSRDEDRSDRAPEPMAAWRAERKASLSRSGG